MSGASAAPAAALKHFAPWGEEIPEWQSARVYLPALLDLDRAITRLERLIWEREYPKHRDTARTHEAIFSPGYSDPLAQWRNTILGVRNHLAALYVIKARTIHDLSQNGLGYTLSDGEVRLPGEPRTVKLDLQFTWL